MTAAFGTTSRRISSRFGVASTFRLVTPVRLPPGRARLPTSPVAIGSAPISKTIGFVGVADFAASAAGAPPGATITATGRAANSAASDGNLSCWPPPSEIRSRHFDPRRIRLRQDLGKSSCTAGERGRRSGAKISDHRHRRLLRARRQRPPGCRAAEERDELAPF